MNSIIHPDDAWSIWTIILCSVALGIYLEQRYKWAAKLTGSVIVIIIGMLLSNTTVLPHQSPV